nr:uncharacterized protein LOC112710710 [Arachis hypogaea]
MARAPIGGRTWRQRNLLPSPSSILSPLSCASGLAVSSSLRLSSPRQLRSSRFTATAFSLPSSRLCSDPLRCVVVRGLSPPSELGCSRVSHLCVCSSCASCSCCLPRLSPSSHLPVPIHLFQEQDCLGALDGTHIKVNVLEADKPRYRNRKGDITTNVLGVVALDMQFIYILAGWEGSAADSRVLRDALFRNGFSVPQGHYYLCDAGYMNCEGFLAPYRGQKYHLSEFNPHNQPSTAQEFFNMKHSQARNVIERAFRVLKAR